MSSGRRETKRVLLDHNKRTAQGVRDFFVNGYSGYEGRESRKYRRWTENKPLEFRTSELGHFQDIKIQDSLFGLGDWNAMQQRRLRNCELKLLAGYLYRGCKLSGFGMEGILLNYGAWPKGSRWPQWGVEDDIWMAGMREAEAVALLPGLQIRCLPGSPAEKACLRCQGDQFIAICTDKAGWGLLFKIGGVCYLCSLQNARKPCCELSLALPWHILSIENMSAISACLLFAYLWFYSSHSSSQ